MLKGLNFYKEIEKPYKPKKNKKSKLQCLYNLFEK